jgi:hypothetical protein
VHFSTLTFKLGQITAGVSRVLTVWNAFLARKTIEISSMIGASGVSVSGLGAGGADLVRPLKASTTTFTITTDGDPLLRARFTFTIDDPA